MSMTVTNIVDITADPEEVWAVLADLPATRWWLPGVVAARLDGDVRVCSMADSQEIHERIGDTPSTGAISQSTTEHTRSPSANWCRVETGHRPAEREVRRQWHAGHVPGVVDPCVVVPVGDLCRVHPRLPVASMPPVAAFTPFESADAAKLIGAARS